MSNEEAYFTPKGWECPKCGRVYSPTTPMCFYCSNKDVRTTFTSTAHTGWTPPYPEGSH